jgi:gag-polyprotein putative aspartyl protease
MRAKCGFDDLPAKPGSGADFLSTYGPTLLVNIGFDPQFDSADLTRVPQLAEVGLHALVDSGATESCIDDDLAKKLALPIVDRRTVSGVGGVHEVNMYLAQIHVPSLRFTLYGAFAGVNLVAGGQSHFALIGRTFLRHFTMTYEGRTGTVTLSNE